MRMRIMRYVLPLAAALLCGCGQRRMPAETERQNTQAGQTAETETAGETPEAEIRFFAAGAADAILLTAGDTAVLIDTGESGFGKEIADFLEERGIGRLDYLILTHFDKDHVGGAAKVIGSVEIGTVLQSNSPKDNKPYRKYLEAAEEKGLEPVTVESVTEFSLGGLEYTVYPPGRIYEKDTSNNSSLIVAVRCGEYRFLMAGDAEDDRMRDFLLTEPETCDVLKMPHHGRWQSTVPALLEAVRPRYAVITSSEEEPEDRAVTDYLADRGVGVYLTRFGTVTVRCGSGGLEIGTEPAD